MAVFRSLLEVERFLICESNRSIELKERNEVKGSLKRLRAFREAWSFSVLVFTACSPSFCVPVECSSIIRQLGTTLVQIRLLSPDLNAKQINEVLEVVQGVNELVQPALRVPVSEVVELRRKGWEHFYGIGPRITVPYQSAWMHEVRKGVLRERVKHPKYTRAAVAHEQGHAIFDLNMHSRVPEWKSHMEKLEAIQKARELIAVALETRFEIEDKLIENGLVREDRRALSVFEALLRDRLPDGRINGGLPSAYTHPLFSEWERAKKLERDAFETMSRVNSDDTLKLNAHMEPFTELFADCVAVLYFEDGAVISKGVNYAGFAGKTFEERRKLASTRGRDFTARYKASSWNHTNPHALLGPVRSHLWKYYLNNPMFRTKRAEILAKLLDVIADEAKELKSLEPREVNERLINSIEDQFQSLSSRIQ
jgi:hypothetical protein